MKDEKTKTAALTLRPVRLFFLEVVHQKKQIVRYCNLFQPARLKKRQLRESRGHLCSTWNTVKMEDQILMQHFAIGEIHNVRYTQFALISRLAATWVGYAYDPENAGWYWYVDKKNRSWISVEMTPKKEPLRFGISLFYILKNEMVKCGDIWLFRYALNHNGNAYDLKNNHEVSILELI